MGIRDDEIKRIEQYAAGLGAKVTWKKSKRGDPPAEWAIDGSEIIMYTWPSKSKMEIILNFVHELAHHMAWVYNNRQGDPKTDRALNIACEIHEEDVPKDQRKLIYETEKADAEYQEQIFHELNIKIPKQRFLVERDLGVWMYEQYYLEGKFPTAKKRNAHRRLLTKRHKEA